MVANEVVLLLCACCIDTFAESKASLETHHCHQGLIAFWKNRAYKRAYKRAFNRAYNGHFGGFLSSDAHFPLKTSVQEWLLTGYPTKIYEMWSGKSSVQGRQRTRNRARSEYRMTKFERTRIALKYIFIKNLRKVYEEIERTKSGNRAYKRAHK